MTWTLILTAFLYKGGVAIYAEPGFKTERSCLDAGNVWIAMQRKQAVPIYEMGSTTSFTAICAQKP